MNRNFLTSLDRVLADLPRKTEAVDRLNRLEEINGDFSLVALEMSHKMPGRRVKNFRDFYLGFLDPVLAQSRCACFHRALHDRGRPRLGDGYQKHTGLVAASAWRTSSPMQIVFGWLRDTTGSFKIGLAAVGWLPLIAFVLIVFYWPKDKSTD